MVETIFLIISMILLMTTIILYYYVNKDLKESIKEYDRIVKEYKDFINKLHE